MLLAGPQPRDLRIIFWLYNYKVTPGGFLWGKVAGVLVVFFRVDNSEFWYFLGVLLKGEKYLLNGVFLGVKNLRHEISKANA